MYDPYLHLPNMDVTNKEEIDQVFSWSMNLPSIKRPITHRFGRQLLIRSAKVSFAKFPSMATTVSSFAFSSSINSDL